MSIARIVRLRIIFSWLRSVVLRLRIILWLAIVTSSPIIVNWSIHSFTMFILGWFMVIFGRFMWSHNDLWLGKIEGLWSVNNRCRHWLGLVQLSIHWNISFVATSITMIVVRIILWLILYFISVTISWSLIVLRLMLRFRIILRLHFISVSSSLRLIMWPVSRRMVGLKWPVC